VADLADYLDLTIGQAQEQFRALASRRPAASFLVNHRHFGGSTAHQAPEPVPSLAQLFSRPPSSVLAMDHPGNLGGSDSWEDAGP
jgi:hypothetical protein